MMAKEAKNSIKLLLKDWIKFPKDQPSLNERKNKKKLQNEMIAQLPAQLCRSITN